MQSEINTKLSSTNPIVVIVIIILIYWYVYPIIVSFFSNLRCNKGKSNELFADVTKTINNAIPTDYRQEDIQIIQPPVYNAYDDTIQSGSLFIPQPEYYNTQGEKIILGDIDPTSQIGSTDLGDNGLNFNLCSKSCCGDQWPVPFKMPVDRMTCGSKDEFVPSNYMCNNGWQDSGCLCLKKDQSKFIDSRGDNSGL